MTYVPKNFSSLFETQLGQDLWAFLNEDANIIRMETATYLSRPAVEPMSPLLEARFGEPVFEDQVKRMTGHMIRQIMEPRGYRFDRSGVPITSPKNRFYSGARYVLPE